MFQKEFADRLLADPGESGYSRLSINARMFCRVARVMDVKPGSFIPMPQVTSTVVELVPRQDADNALGLGEEYLETARELAAAGVGRTRQVSSSTTIVSSRGPRFDQDDAATTSGGSRKTSKTANAPARTAFEPSEAELLPRRQTPFLEWDALTRILFQRRRRSVHATLKLRVYQHLLHSNYRTYCSKNAKRGVEPRPSLFKEDVRNLIGEVSAYPAMSLDVPHLASMLRRFHACGIWFDERSIPEEGAEFVAPDIEAVVELGQRGVPDVYGEGALARYRQMQIRRQHAELGMTTDNLLENYEEDNLALNRAADAAGVVVPVGSGQVASREEEEEEEEAEGMESLFEYKVPETRGLRMLGTTRRHDAYSPRKYIRRNGVVL